MALPIIHPLSFGEILEGAFMLYRRNFARLLGTSAVVAAVMMAAGLFLAGVGTLAGPVLHPALGAALLAPVAAVLVSLGWSSLTWQAARLYQGKPAPLGDSLAVALIGAMPLVGACLVAWIATGIAGGVGFLGLLALEQVVDPGHLPVPTPVGIAVVALPCLLAAALFFGVVPAVVLEDQGPLEAVERSVELAWGALPRIAGALAVAALVGVVPAVAVAWLIGAPFRLTGPLAAEITPGGWIAERVLHLAVVVLTAPVVPCVIALLFHDQRVRKEPLALEIAARRHPVAGA